MTMGRILLVDDDEAIRTVVSEALRREGHMVVAAGSVAEQTQQLETFTPDILITDVVLPDGNGLDNVPKLLERWPHLPIIVLSAQNTLSTAVRATEQGAFEYLPKPFDLDELCRAVRDGLRRTQAQATSSQAPEDNGGLPLIGRSSAMQDVYRTIARVVPNDLSVLILGESGTGKELVAKAIHDLGPRKAGLDLLRGNVVGHADALQHTRANKSLQRPGRDGENGAEAIERNRRRDQPAKRWA